MNKSRLLRRSETKLAPQKGIATKNGFVIAVQVQFRGGPYPDRMSPDGSIEHIGEGLDGDQRPLRGNKAMLLAERRQHAIEVYEKQGTDAYRFLGQYTVDGHDYRELDIGGRKLRAYLFQLAPAE